MPGHPQSGGDNFDGSFMSMHDLERRWFTNDGFGSIVNHFAIVLALVDHHAGSGKANFFVGGDGEIQRILKLVPSELLRGSQHASQRALHVATAATIQPFASNRWLEAGKLASEPLLGRYDVRVAEISQATFAGPFFWQSDLLSAPVLVDVLNSLNHKPCLVSFISRYRLINRFDLWLVESKPMSRFG